MHIITYFFFTTISVTLLFFTWSYSRSLLSDTNVEYTSFSPSQFIFSLFIATLTGILLIPEHTRTNKRSKDITSIFLSISLLSLLLMTLVALSKHIFPDSNFLAISIKLIATSLVLSFIPLRPTPGYVIFKHLLPTQTTFYTSTLLLLPVLLLLGSILELLGIPVLGYSILYLADTIITLMHFAL